MTNPIDEPAKPGYEPRPRWVKWLLVVAAVVLLVVVVALLAGGEHGPGRHLSGGGVEGSSPMGVAASTSTT